MFSAYKIRRRFALLCLSTLFFSSSSTAPIITSVLPNYLEKVPVQIHSETDIKIEQDETQKTSWEIGYTSLLWVLHTAESPNTAVLLYLYVSVGRVRLVRAYSAYIASGTHGGPVYVTVVRATPFHYFLRLADT